jgi:predicted TPR repeat methyltransferase
MSETEPLRAFYLRNNDGERSIFDIWERGGARGDSVTPSTYSVPYRLWMSDLLRKFLTESEPTGLLSMGCGNAAIEAGLTAEGHRVLGVDALTEAVELARAKGVDAVRADVLTWMPPPGPWTVVYADGVLGHLYDPEQGVRHVLRRFRSWLGAGGALVISNDGPNTDAEVQAHPDVPGFAWLSRAYLHRQVGECGFRDVTSSHFMYERPVSGQRERVIVTARV